MVKGIAHTAYIVRDMQQILDFYCEKLGFTHAFSISDQKGNPWIEYVKVADHQFLEFFYAEPGQSMPKGSYGHICFEVEDIFAQEKALQQAGVSIRIAPNQGKDGNWQCWADDPDGNAIEFMQINPDSPQAHA